MWDDRLNKVETIVKKYKSKIESYGTRNKAEEGQSMSLF